MRRISRIERRSLLLGWFKWVALVAIPFSVLFFDTRLNIQIRHKDYELGQLNMERRRLDAELDIIHSREAQLSGVEYLSVIADQLALAPPDTQQFQSIAYREAPRRIPVMTASETEIASSRPTEITLNQETPVTLAQQALPSARFIKSGADPIASVIHEGSVSLLPVSLEGPSVTLEQPAPHIVDPDLSMLTVEDMMGKL